MLADKSDGGQRGGRTDALLMSLKEPVAGNDSVAPGS